MSWMRKRYDVWSFGMQTWQLKFSEEMSPATSVMRLGYSGCGDCKQLHACDRRNVSQRHGRFFMNISPCIICFDLRTGC